jgi:hypothetical protein
MLERIKREIATDPYYSQNYVNDGQRFVAWYLRRILLCSPTEARQAVTDGADDKQIDAIVVDDDKQRVLVIQGKFMGETTVDAEPLREVLGAWVRLQDLETLQKDCNDRLKERLEAVRRAFDDEYEVEFELLTTGTLTEAARADLEAFTERLASMTDFPASLHLVDTGVIETRLAEAEGRDLPTLDHEIALDPRSTIFTDMQGTRCVIAAVPLIECLKLPGIQDGRLFRKNVRQFLGSNNKVNRGLRATLNGERVRDFFFYHNGITALCQKFELSDDGTRLRLHDLSVVNGCQSLATIYSASERIRSLPASAAQVLFRFYEIPQRDLADRISTFTNSQSTVKPRDLRSNDQVMLSLKRAYETVYRDGLFITQRGTTRPADKDADKTVDCAEFAKAVMAWQCQRPNIAYNEKRLFDEYYKTLFRQEYDPASILALQTWLNAIERAWPNLALNDALKAGKSYVRFHVLYSISSLIAHASGQGDKVPHPSATMVQAKQYADEILPLAVNCVNKAMESAIQQAQLAGRVFSPQNWSKSTASVQGETLVASTMIGMLPGIGAQSLIDKIKVAPGHFGFRWSAE